MTSNHNPCVFVHLDCCPLQRNNNFGSTAQGYIEGSDFFARFAVGCGSAVLVRFCLGVRHFWAGETRKTAVEETAILLLTAAEAESSSSSISLPVCGRSLQKFAKRLRKESSRLCFEHFCFWGKTRFAHAPLCLASHNNSRQLAYKQ